MEQHTPAYETGYSTDHPIDIRPMQAVQRAARGSLARNHGDVPSRVRYPTPLLIIDPGTLLARSADHPNDRARSKRVGVSGRCGPDWYYGNGGRGHGPNSRTIGVIDKQCHAPAPRQIRSRQRRRDRPLCTACRTHFSTRKRTVYRSTVQQTYESYIPSVIFPRLLPKLCSCFCFRYLLERIWFIFQLIYRTQPMLLYRVLLQFLIIIDILTQYLPLLKLNNLFSDYI